MKIVIAPDSYKESLTALEVATEIEAGFREVFPDADYLILPMAMAVKAPLQLTGTKGASAVFGPQKGATPGMVEQLDANLCRYAGMISRDLGIQVELVPGAGATGGMGAALLASLGAQLRPGIEIVVETVGLEAYVKDADLVITGEGRIDSQTINGKTPIGVARMAKRYRKPVIGIAGCLASNASVVHEHGIDAVFSVLSQVGSVDEALRCAALNVQTASRNIAATLKFAGEMQQGTF